MLTIIIVIIIFFAAFIILIRNSSRPRRLGIYSQPNPITFPFKFHLMRLLIARQQTIKRNYPISTSTGYDGGWTSSSSFRRSIVQLECKQQLPSIVDAPMAVDAVFFNGANSDRCYLAMGVAQRQNDVYNTFLMIRLPDVGILELVGMPETNTIATSIDDGNQIYATSGITVKCVEPMQQWHIDFDGKMQLKQNRDDGRRQIVNVQLHIEWNNIGDHFDFDIDSSPIAIARAIATESWSIDMFRRLKQSHQTHYEQFGRLHATIDIEGYGSRTVTLTSMRDHTIARHRNWGELRRYIMTTFHLDDGTCIHTSLISMPETVFSQIELGYMVVGSDAYRRNIPVDRIHLQLADLGENGHIPDTFSYAFDADGKRYQVTVVVIERTTFQMGIEQNTTVHECMCEFVVNGVRGYGLSEWEYRCAF